MFFFSVDLIPELPAGFFLFVCIILDFKLMPLLCSQQLAELLKSKKPEDLQEANRLIKNMVMEVRRILT